jgi:polyribonucleotide nucleotidyltransferase
MKGPEWANQWANQQTKWANQQANQQLNALKDQISEMDFKIAGTENGNLNI